MTRSAVVSRYLQTGRSTSALCERGNTDEEIATILGVSGRTLHSWKLQHEEFASALKRSKAEVNELVEASLFTRAADFEREVEKVFRNGKRLKFGSTILLTSARYGSGCRTRMPEVYRRP
jgi:transposase-like protein